ELIQRMLNLRKITSKLRPQILARPQVGRFDSLHRSLGAFDQRVQLGAGMHIEISEAFEELSQIIHGAVAKYLTLSVLAADPLAQMIDQSGELFGKCLLRKLHRFLEASLHPPAFLPIQFGIEFL